MAKVYARLVCDGKWTIDQVPDRWREQVKALLDQER